MAVPHIEPMTAVIGDVPESGPWAFEPKWDGMRCLVELDGARVRLRGRSGRDVTVEFPELAALAELAPVAVLDGEIVALDEAGRPSFGRLQQRFGVADLAVARARATSVPATFVAFDLLHLDGLDAWRLPYEQRRLLLEQLVEPSAQLALTPSGTGDGHSWLDGARATGMEGVMAKRMDRPYEPGRRSTSWRKLKIRHEQEFVVCGATPGKGRRDDLIGALVLCCRDETGWRWVGNAGTGLSDAELDWWSSELAATRCELSPLAPGSPSHAALRGVAWATPTHVVQVAFSEWTRDGRLRHPAVLGRRLDVSAHEVSCEREPVID